MEIMGALGGTEQAHHPGTLLARHDDAFGLPFAGAQE